MKYVKVKNVNVPIIGFGTWCIGDDPSIKDRELATFDAGYKKYQMTLIDTAEMYGSGKSERVIGEFLKGKNREEFYIVNKILPSNAIDGLYEERCRNSLKIMGLEYFDLYLLHWRNKVDLQDMVNNMEHLKKLGLIKNWGVSNFDVKDMEELFKCKDGDKCFANQCLYNVLSRGVQYDLIPWCNKHNVLFMAYSPLGNNSSDRNSVTNNPKFKEIAKINDRTPESLMLSYVISFPNVVTVFKTSNISHLDSNMKNVLVPLSETEKQLIDNIFPKINKKVALEKI